MILILPRLNMHSDELRKVACLEPKLNLEKKCWVRLRLVLVIIHKCQL